MLLSIFLVSNNRESAALFFEAGKVIIFLNESTTRESGGLDIIGEDPVRRKFTGKL